MPYELAKWLGIFSLTVFQKYELHLSGHIVAVDSYQRFSPFLVICSNILDQSLGIQHLNQIHSHSQKSFRPIPYGLVSHLGKAISISFHFRLTYTRWREAYDNFLSRLRRFWILSNISQFCKFGDIPCESVNWNRFSIQKELYSWGRLLFSI